MEPSEFMKYIIHAGGHGAAEMLGHGVQIYEASGTVGALLTEEALLKLATSFGKGFVIGTVLYLADEVFFSAVPYCGSYCPTCNGDSQQGFHCHLAEGHGDEHECKNWHTWAGDPVGASSSQLWDP
jgi:hypothetical protein